MLLKEGIVGENQEVSISVYNICSVLERYPPDELIIDRDIVAHSMRKWARKIRNPSRWIRFKIWLAKICGVSNYMILVANELDQLASILEEKDINKTEIHA